ncbi:unnamed protein product [Cercopithifilaria johnstoni]|uniref:Uncharacterized protein n=1 Tax=Cercopithifilaria johnstoni TaxID=2874296 RepID=A0A8J2PXW0_9BILA|nr:unnamed protein product [Cercopithifilaria johnstoni]
MKRCQNPETAKATVHSVVRSKHSKMYEQPPQRKCSKLLNAKISINETWEKVSPIRKQKSIHRPLILRKIKRTNEGILQQKTLSQQRNSLVFEKEKVLDSLSAMKEGDECLRFTVEGKAESLMKLSEKVVRFALVLNKWVDGRCKLCNARLTSFNMIKKQTQWRSKTCKTLKLLQQDRSTKGKEPYEEGRMKHKRNNVKRGKYLCNENNKDMALSTLAMSPNKSEEIILNDGNIEYGIPAEELMDEEYVLQLALSTLTISPDNSEEIVLNDGNIEYGIPAEELMDEEYILQLAENTMPVDYME